MKKHSRINKLIHKIYLKNYYISKSTLSFEFDKYDSEIQKFNFEKSVFITGLARSGTTILLREIHDSKTFSSLQYKNMPFLFLPNTYQIKSNDKPSERSHKDNIKISGESPEEFDEYFWKVFMKDSYIKNDSLIKHDLENKILEDYIKYVKLVCISKNKPNYISKNNNNILRITSLLKIPNSIFFILVRKPLDHVSSLMKLHSKFTEDHKNDPFSLEYFNVLGHHEFGMNQKPFKLIDRDFEKLKKFTKNQIEYWLIIWKQYYEYLINIFNDRFNIILFEDLLENRGRVNQHINQLLNINIKTQVKDYKSPNYKKVNNKLLDQCNEIYLKLREKIKY